MVFVNFSNHNSAMWSKSQIDEAEKWGEIIDIPFPSVPAELDENAVEKMAEQYTESIADLCPAAVMCQGEFSLAYAVISKLKEKEIVVVTACSDRKAEEAVMPDGKVLRKSEFVFVRFRKY